MNKDRQRRLEARARRFASLRGVGVVEKAGNTVVIVKERPEAPKTKDEIRIQREKFIQKAKKLAMEKGISPKEAAELLKSKKLGLAQKENKQNELRVSVQGKATDAVITKGKE